jgi:hypothetical protein
LVCHCTVSSLRPLVEQLGIRSRVIKLAHISLASASNWVRMKQLAAHAAHSFTANIGKGEALLKIDITNAFNTR